MHKLPLLETHLQWESTAEKFTFFGMCSQMGHGPPISPLARSLKADLKELRNFVTDIQTDRTDDRRQTTDDRQSAL
ncbi:hypothetical protein V3C99_012997 [Haemonchus contortus]